MIRVEHPTKKVRIVPPGIRNKYAKFTNGERHMLDPIEDPDGNWVVGDEVLMDQFMTGLMNTVEPNNGGPPISQSLSVSPYVFNVDSTNSILVLENIVGTFQIGETVSQTTPNRSSDILSFFGTFLIEVTIIDPGFVQGNTITGQTSGATATIISYNT